MSNYPRHLLTTSSNTFEHSQTFIKLPRTISNIISNIYIFISVTAIDKMLAEKAARERYVVLKKDIDDVKKKEKIETESMAQKNEGENRRNE